MNNAVLYEVKDGVAILTVDNPPVNPLSDGVRAGFVNNIDKLIHSLTAFSLINISIAINPHFSGA